MANGEEDSKGNVLVQTVHPMLKQLEGINFIGNVEGRDIPAGECDRGPIDVVVCDGFVGNVLLKFYERVAPMLIGMVAQHANFDRAVVVNALKQLDADEHGGAPLLGVQGVSIISHGKSSPRALMNAIRVAILAVESDMTAEIGRRLALSMPSVETSGEATAGSAA